MTDVKTETLVLFSIEVNGVHYAQQSAPTPLQAAARFVDEFVPDIEKLVFRGRVHGQRVVFRTQTFLIVVEPVEMEVPA